MRALAHDHLRAAARHAPEQAALIADGRTHTYADLDGDSDALAAWLQGAGVTRGDRVAVLLDNSHEQVVALWGALKAGAVVTVLNPASRPDKVAYILRDCDARHLVTHRRLHRVVRASLAHDAGPAGIKASLWVGGVPETAEAAAAFDDVVGDGADGAGRPHARPRDPGTIDNDLAAIIYTSGSTGGPKGVMLTHRNVHHNAWSIARSLGLRSDDVVGSVLSLSFTYGLFQVVAAAHIGATVVLERSFAYPYEVLARFAAHRVTVVPGVPTMFATVLQMAPLDGLDLTSVRMLTNAAAALPAAHRQRLGDLLPQAGVVDMYGLTECTRVCSLDPADAVARPGSVGRPIPNTEAYVLDDEGRRLPPGQVGELVVRGAHVMRGYWGRPDETARRLRDGDIPGEKVLHTGDLFRADEDGYLYFVGRTDDVFKCRGEKVSPTEIEHVLYELDAVAEAAVVGMPDEIEGMAVKAVVVARPGAELTANDVRRHCRARLEAVLVPTLVEVRDELPKTDSGKIRRADLR